MQWVPEHNQNYGNIDRRVILPASYVGSPQDMNDARFQDAMAIVCKNLWEARLLHYYDLQSELGGEKVFKALFTIKFYWPSFSKMSAPKVTPFLRKFKLIFCPIKRPRIDRT